MGDLQDLPRVILAKEFTLKALEKFTLPNDPTDAGTEVAALFNAIYAGIPKNGYLIDQKAAAAKQTEE